MKALLKALTTSLVLMMMGYSIQAQAGLMKIGTATYNDGTTTADYNLIWDDNNNGNSVVWLDYTNDPTPTDWQSQKDWALGLGSAITSYNIDPGYTITWADADWRLPTIVDGDYVIGYDGTTTAGYNITNSEIGHLYYDELGNQGYYDTSGVYVGNGNYGLNNTGDFQNLASSVYWSGTEFSGDTDVAWFFLFDVGFQGAGGTNDGNLGLAVRSGDVATAAVPEPATIALLGIGLAGMVGGYGVRRRRQLTKR